MNRRRRSSPAQRHGLVIESTPGWKFATPAKSAQARTRARAFLGLTGAMRGMALSHAEPGTVPPGAVMLSRPSDIGVAEALFFALLGGAHSQSDAVRLPGAVDEGARSCGQARSARGGEGFRARLWRGRAF